MRGLRAAVATISLALILGPNDGRAAPHYHVRIATATGFAAKYAFDLTL